MEPLETHHAISTESVVLHASTVALNGIAAVILGPSGSGKSSLALQLMAFGAELVADDRTRIIYDAQLDVVIAAAPPSLPALIEARGVGLLPASLCGPKPIGLVIDLGKLEATRLPEERTMLLLGHSVALLHPADNAHFPHAVVQYLKGLSAT